MENMKQMKVCIVGTGHIGLPTACVIADAGIDVIAADINEKIVDAVNQGRSLVKENGLEPLLKKVVSEKKLTASTDVTASVSKASVILIIVPTPLQADGPDISAIRSAGKAVARGLKKGDLVVLESTIYPEGTKKILKLILEEHSDLKAGTDFFLAYSPERALPTKSISEIRDNVRIVGGIDPESGKKAVEFYSRFVTNKVVDVGDSTTAEFIKISENVYRDVNIALANELALISANIGIDVKKVIKTANLHPRVDIHEPGAGVGGHCIPKDPYFLINKAKENDLDLGLIGTARRINERMPKYVVGMTEEALSNSKKSINGSKVTVLGYAYKGDTSDVRGTPSKVIVNELKSLGAQVTIQDPYVDPGNGTAIEKDLIKSVTGSDCLIIVTDHTDYRKINIEEVSKRMRKPGIIIDGRNILEPAKVRDSGLIYYGIGR